MKAAGHGAIVNIASEWGLNGEPNHVAYCASKGAVIQITRCMALDHARDNIRVNSVCPGEIHTRMVDAILADLASYVTGASLSVDGGNDATAGPYP
jgi:NAD(P)-dependent dehydrogenase (short-subunit alcohol dehydrogenase family)